MSSSTKTPTNLAHDRPSTSFSTPIPNSTQSPPIVHLLSSTSKIIVGNNDNGSISSNVLLQQQKQGRPIYQDFVCGMLAAVAETSITYPLNKMIFRQQLLGLTTRQSFLQLEQEGMRYLYRGLMFPLMQKAASRALMFGMYDEYRQLLGCRYVQRGGGGESTTTTATDGGKRRYSFTWCHASAAFMAGATEAIGLTPFERVQILMQTTKYHNSFKNSFEALKFGLRPYGIREYYRGLSTIVFRNGFSNVMFFALRNPLKDFFARADRATIKDLSSHRQLIADFVSGACSGAMISSVFYPINVIKARMQSRLGGEFETPWAVLMKILRERQFSVRYLYRGVGLNFTRSMLTWGLTNAGYEFFQRHLFGKGKTAGYS